MCGFLGIYRPGATAGQGAHDEARIRAELAAIAGRGPDGVEAVRNGPLTLAAVRLAMIGGDLAAQPMTSPNSGLVLAFNGEIYDHRHLRQRLARSWPFRTDDSDTETLCALLRLHGPGVLAEVDGQYAVAAFEPGQHRLTLVRDRFGIHPLYYATDGDVVFFGSSARAVARLYGRTELAPEAIYLMLALWGMPEPMSVYRGVNTVRAGWAMRFTTWGASEHPIDPVAIPPEGYEHRLDDDELVAAFDGAVEARLRADVDLGLLLSGGVDSGAVAQSASLAGYRLPAYVLVSSDDTEGEVTSAARTAAACGHHLRPVCVPEEALAERLVRTVRDTDTPLWRTGPIGFHALAAAVRRDGVKGLLTGDGSDELFCGYDIFPLTLARLAIANPSTRAAGLARLGAISSARGLVHGEHPPLALAPYASTDVVYSHLPRWRTQAGAALRLFHPDLRTALREYNPAVYMRDTYADELKALSPLNRARLIELRTLFQGFLISAQSDRPFMSHGIEGRYPFLSRAVANLALQTDPSLFVTATEAKTPVRRRLAARLAPELGETPKRPYDAGPLSGCDGLNRIYDRYLSTDAITMHAMFDAGRVSALLAAIRRPKRPREVDVTMLLGVLTTQVMAHG